jgi:hypothetical protein
MRSGWIRNSDRAGSAAAGGVLCKNEGDDRLSRHRLRAMMACNANGGHGWTTSSKIRLEMAGERETVDTNAVTYTKT